MKIETVKEILKSKAYNFAVEIEPVYKVLGWGWGGTDGYLRIPNVDDIYDFAVELIDKFNEPGYISSGGIEIFWKENEGEIGIRFVYEDIHFYDEK